jgi:hypothetical protein
MEDYIRFITDIVDDARDGGIQPVYGITRQQNLEEVISADLPPPATTPSSPLPGALAMPVRSASAVC